MGTTINIMGGNDLSLEQLLMALMGASNSNGSTDSTDSTDSNGSTGSCTTSGQSDQQAAETMKGFMADGKLKLTKAQMSQIANTGRLTTPFGTQEVPENVKQAAQSIMSKPGMFDAMEKGKTGKNDGVLSANDINISEGLGPMGLSPIFGQIQTPSLFGDDGSFGGSSSNYPSDNYV